jgi:protein disulfide-isomerase A6
VTGFPTIKWFPAGSKDAEDYSGGRSAADFVDFINRKAGTNAKVKSAPSAVTVLTDSNFESIVLDAKKDVLVEFYAPCESVLVGASPLHSELTLLLCLCAGCGHCKRLAPDYEKVGTRSVILQSLSVSSWIVFRLWCTYSP